VAYVRFTDNLKRIETTISLAKDAAATVLSPADADIIRMCVVFLHAAFEDYLKSIGRLVLPSAGESAINKIPLVGPKPQAEPRKFLLGELVKHRDKSVQRLIEESIEQHFLRRTFNSAEEVIAFLTDLGLDTSGSSPFLADLQWVMSRRHQIVHAADIPPNSFDNLPIWSREDSLAFLRGAKAVLLFADKIMLSAIQNPETAKGAAQLVATNHANINALP
jgi:hypothetical protein